MILRMTSTLRGMAPNSEDFWAGWDLWKAQVTDDALSKSGVAKRQRSGDPRHRIRGASCLSASPLLAAALVTGSVRGCPAGHAGRRPSERLSGLQTMF